MHEFIRTEDGSTTLYVPELKEHYHSVHGAIRESLHIFIRAGLDFYHTTFPGRRPLHILEAGFGTGLNAYLALLWAQEHSCPLHYHSIEKYPLSPEEAGQLNYTDLLPAGDSGLFGRLHECPWERTAPLTPFFSLHKQKSDFRETAFSAAFDLVFFDAFNPGVQPHLWTVEVLNRFAGALQPGGMLVTYCVKGTVKQALRDCGFTLERLPGPPGKRQMLRARLPENENSCR